MNKVQRLIHNLTKNETSWMLRREARLLYKYAKRSSHNIVEIGTYKAGTTCILCEADKTKGERVFSIDISQPDSNHDRIKQLGYKATLIENDSKIVAEEWDRGDIGLLFLDGSRRYKNNLIDLLLWTPHIAIGGYLALHDMITRKRFRTYKKRGRVDRIGRVTIRGEIPELHRSSRHSALRTLISVQWGCWTHISRRHKLQIYRKLKVPNYYPMPRQVPPSTVQ